MTKLFVELFIPRLHRFLFFYWRVLRCFHLSSDELAGVNCRHKAILSTEAE